MGRQLAVTERFIVAFGAPGGGGRLEGSRMAFMVTRATHVQVGDACRRDLMMMDMMR